MAIISSLLDTDFYQITTGHFVWKRYADVLVKYAFKNRSNAPLALVIPEEELRYELDSVRSLNFINNELSYLRKLKKSDGLPLFHCCYTEVFLRNFRLPEYNLERVGDDYKLEFIGKWSEVTYWETPALEIINELYFRNLLKRNGVKFSVVWNKEGKRRLDKKIEILKPYPGVRIFEFGTRRRFNTESQRLALGIALDEIPDQIVGTSNVLLAMELGIKPVGTMLHALFMVMAGIMSEQGDLAILRSHNKALREWWDEYGYDLSIALTDTYGTDFFFQDFSPEQAWQWKGLRYDSGEPIIFGDKAIAFYEKLGIPSKSKQVIFSNELNAKSIVEIYNYFKKKFIDGFGLGTNFTNDMGPMYKPLSIVIKAMKANGFPLVKLTDNLAKASGRPEDIERFKKIFGYSGKLFQKCRY